MGQSFRSTLGALIIFAGLGACLFWAVEPVPGAYWMWLGRISCPLIVIVSAALLIYAKTRKNKAPDLLGDICSRYFERDGLCFAIIPEVVENQPRLSVYYQNRYEQSCDATIWLAPTKVAFKDVSELPSVTATIACGGGEFGRMFCEFGLPLSFRGQEILWDVAAKTRYPRGRGQLLRLRDGMRVGKESQISGGREFLRFIAVFAHIHSEKSARLTLTFPEEVFSFPHAGDWKQETLWTPGRPAA